MAAPDFFFFAKSIFAVIAIVRNQSRNKNAGNAFEKKTIKGKSAHKNAGNTMPAFFFSWIVFFFKIAGNALASCVLFLLIVFFNFQLKELESNY